MLQLGHLNVETINLITLPFNTFKILKLAYVVQVCGTTLDTKVVKNTDWALCGYLYCNNAISRQLHERRELCRLHETCVNLDEDHKVRLRCCDEVDGNVTDVENCENKEDDFGLKGGTICDAVCDDWNCADESECNGFLYGKLCKHTFRGISTYIPPYEVCNVKVDCNAHKNYGIDEKGCTAKLNPELSTCMSGNLFRMKNIRREVPIFNFTRCSSIEVSETGSTGARFGIWTSQTNATKVGIPYCLDYIDQTNCSDIAKTAVSCDIKGYGYSTISKSMVCGQFRKGFCEDEMDLACVDVDRNCTLHKHQLCDEIEDCSSGADEKNPACLQLTDHKCFRNFRTGRKLKIPVSWLGDGLKDCINGTDENWHIVCGKSELTRRFEISEDCQEVFICRYGDESFIRLSELCNGIDKCGNENVICQVGRSLSSISTAVRTTGKSKTLKYCHRGLEDVVNKRKSLCVSQAFNIFNENLYGVQSQSKVTYPIEKTDCRFVFGEAYVLLSCLGRCKNSPCPLKKPVAFNDCPDQFRGRIYTVANKNRLTFVTRRANDYQNNYFVCNNGLCVDYDKVCNVWDDCGDGSDEVNCTNSFHCKDKQGIIPLSKKCDSNPDCGDMSDECNSDCSKEIINQPFLKGAAWFIGLMAIISNSVVLFENGTGIRRCKSADTVTNKLLVNLIGLGDFFVGVYLIGIAAADSVFLGKGYCEKQFQWLTSWYCSSLGVISTFGSLVSLFSLTTLSSIRSFKIYKGAIPQDEDISSKKKLSVAGLISLIVFAAAMIASVTLMSALEDYFVNGLVYDNSIKIFKGSMIGKQKHLEVIQSYYGRSKDKTLRWRLIENLVRSMFSKDYENLDGKIARVDFYGNDGVCLFKFFVTRDDPQWVFTMIILAISIVCFTIVAAAYIYINVSTYKSSKCLTKEAGPTAKTVNKRNRKLQRKVATIIMTDFLCWVPFVLICLLHSFEVMNASSYYGFFSIIILPINSVINPFLYSEVMWHLTKKVSSVFAKCSRPFLGLFKARNVEDHTVNQTQRENEFELKSMVKVSKVERPLCSET